MIEFPRGAFLDERKSHDFLMGLHHPDELACPCGCLLATGQFPHRRQRRPAVVDWRCRFCGRVFNLFTGTLCSGSCCRCSSILLILRGFAQGVPTLHLSKELGLDDKTLLRRRHQLQGNAFDNRKRSPLEDQDIEADEMFQNAGEKETPHPDPGDPARRHANKRRGRGTMGNDRPRFSGRSAGRADKSA